MRLFERCPPGWKSSSQILLRVRASCTCAHDHRGAFLYVCHIPSFVFLSLSPRMDDHLDDSFSDVESDIFSTRSAASSATSQDVSMRSGSPAPSIYSVTSSIRAASYRHEYGRGLNNYSEVYQLPADDEELDRLGTAFANLSFIYPRLSYVDMQHEMFKNIMGAYPPPMADVMADTPWETKSVLDLGCGSGSWYVFFPYSQLVPTTFQDNGGGP
ncbi:hypothetical protein BJV77DRAFT_13573 [Russula vinacea]|nr:hypothetical protein BJV77DRAFT_13573 [Russula vinacea]